MTTEWLSPAEESIGKRRHACCGIDDYDVLMWLVATLMFGCCGGIHKGKIMSKLRLEALEAKAIEMEHKAMRRAGMGSQAGTEDPKKNGGKSEYASHQTRSYSLPH